LSASYRRGLRSGNGISELLASSARRAAGSSLGGGGPVSLLTSLQHRFWQSVGIGKDWRLETTRCQRYRIPAANWSSSAKTCGELVMGCPLPQLPLSSASRTNR